jgi:hypothetical protein
MTQQEKEWTQKVFKDAMEIVAICGLLDARAPEGSKEQMRGRRASEKALALADAAAARLAQADVVTEAQELVAGDYDLAALAAAPPSKVEE